jgi:1A family penicillin-binding protein
MPIPQLKPKSKYEKTWRVSKITRHSVDKKKKFKSLASRLLPYLAVFILLCFIIGIAVFAWLSKDLPNPDKVIERSIAQSTKILARDEKTVLYDIHGDQKRTAVNLEEVSNYMRWATIAVEDKNFYKHKGFSLPRIFKVVIIDALSGKRAQGASTITQQFVKNAILTAEKSFTRKIKELVLAYQIERKFTKDQILKMYFNEIPFGSNNYGVEAASETFFGKKAKDLDIAESALLAALPKAPTYYSPYGSHQDDLVARQKMIIDLMVEQGYIKKEQGDEAKKIDILKQVKPKSENILAPHFVMYIKEYLTSKYGEVEVEQGGMRVITTLDYDLQKIAEEEVKKGAEKNESKYKAKNAALVSLNPKTGEILAMVGSRDYFDKENDGNVNVTLRPRQPGSSFKPIVYATAFTKGYTPETILFDLKTVFKTDTKDYIPQNYDGKEHGPLSIRQTLAGSLNIPAVKTLYLVGVDNVLNLAEQFGYTTFKDRSRFGLSLVLGGGEVKLLEHTSGLGTFATEGIHHPYVSILRIEDSKGKVVEKFKPLEGKKVVDVEVARQIESIMSDNNARSFIFGSQNYLTLGSRPVGAKTGTTDDYRDAWTIGYTPSLVTGVWVGNNDNSEMKRGADGSVVAAPIWNGFMKRALVGKPVENFTAPKPSETTKSILKGQLEGEVPIKVDKITQKLIPDSCLDSWPKAFVEDKILKEVHCELYYINREDPTGPIPKDPTTDPQFANWEEPVRKWAESKGYLNTRPALENCSLRSQSNLPTVSFNQPIDQATISSSPVTISVSASSLYSIKQVEYFIDDISVGTSIVSPFSLEYSMTGLTNGVHSIKARVYDVYENTNDATISINLSLPKSQSSLYFITPSQGAKIKQADFPYNLSAFAADPEGVSLLSFYYLDPLNTQFLISAVTPSENTVTTIWLAVPPGQYRLYLVMKNKKEATSQSDYLNITVE